MKRSQILKVSLAALLAFAICTPGFSLKLGGKEMVKNGAGSRTRLFIKVYYATLFVPQELKGAGDSKIIESDQPMAISIYITSSKVTKDKFVEAIADAFDQSAKAGYATGDKQAYIDAFKNVTISEGDSVNNNFDGKAMKVEFYSKARNTNTTLAIIKGLQFKKGFFGIFLSSKPIQDSLKANLLGK